jgi:hypothetical protein
LGNFFPFGYNIYLLYTTSIFQYTPMFCPHGYSNLNYSNELLYKGMKFTRLQLCFFCGITPCHLSYNCSL